MNLSQQRIVLKNIDIARILARRISKRFPNRANLSWDELISACQFGLCMAVTHPEYQVVKEFRPWAFRFAWAYLNRDFKQYGPMRVGSHIVDRKGLVSNDLEQYDEIDTDPIRSMIADEEREMLYNGIKCLNIRNQNIIKMWLRGQSTSQISKQFHIHITTVNRSLRSSIGKLKRSLSLG